MHILAIFKHSLIILGFLEKEKGEHNFALLSPKIYLFSKALLGDYGNSEKIS